MSDAGRQGLGDKLASSVKPDSQKTYTEQAGDFIKGKTDNAASNAQPSQEKGLGQKIADAVNPNASNNRA